MSVSLADFKQLSLLGEGAYSAVYKVQRLADGGTYALKKVKLPSLSDKEKQNALNEIRLLASVRHENVISYKEAFFDDETRCLCIVTECADGGDLLQQIVKCQKEKTHLKEADVWRYMLGMACGIRALHSMKVLHRDLKCANIFLSRGQDGRAVAKIGDFNVSTVAKRGLCMTQTGTPYYASPEVWRDMPYDGKSDIWSLGCVLYEAAALRPPFQAKDMEGLYRKVLRGQYPRLPQHYSQDLSDVIAALLQVNPRHRPSAEQLLQLPQMRAKAAELGMGGNDDNASDLLRTIKVPRNVIDISSYLPRPRYNDDDTPKSVSRGASALRLPPLEEQGRGRCAASPSVPALPRARSGSNEEFLSMLDPASVEAPPLQQSRGQDKPPLPRGEEQRRESGKATRGHGHSGSQPPPRRRERKESREHKRHREHRLASDGTRERRPLPRHADNSDDDAPSERAPPEPVPRKAAPGGAVPRLPRILSEPGRLISGT